MSEYETYSYYTDYNQFITILKDGRLDAGEIRGVNGDGTFGNGIYFTTLRPTTTGIKMVQSQKLRQIF